MNEDKAREIAEKITNAGLQEMFDNAKVRCVDWERRSNVNKSMSKGAAWDILAANFDINHNYNIIAKTDMVREFGEFIPKDASTAKLVASIKEKIQLVHQSPKFK
jgi:hypothetical protein